MNIMSYFTTRQIRSQLINSTPLRLPRQRILERKILKLVRENQCYEYVKTNVLAREVIDVEYCSDLDLEIMINKYLLEDLIDEYCYEGYNMTTLQEKMNEMTQRVTQ